MLVGGPMDDALEHAGAVAESVLYEGYLLYPYRASATKNRARWQFGVLVPPSYRDTGTGEHTVARTECLAEAGPDARLHVRARFLQVQARTVQESSAETYRDVATLTVDGEALAAWDESVERECECECSVDELLAGPCVVPVQVPGGTDVEPVSGGRVVRSREPLCGQLRCHAERPAGADGTVRVHVTLANTSTVDCTEADRAEALRHSMIAAHTVLELRGGRFISMTAPPEWAAAAAKACVNEHTWPVLIGDEQRRDAMLSAAIILYDYPKIDPRSNGDFYDACEIDELLTLCTLTLTEDEKREARATDAKSRQLLDRVHELPSETMERLHGAVSYLDKTYTTGPEPHPAAAASEPWWSTEPDQPPVWWTPEADAAVCPESDTVRIGGEPVSKGSRVVLRPGSRSTDAQDMFLAGMVATVQAVLVDVGGARQVAVTVDDDPATEWQLAQARYRYFAVDEVEPLANGARP